MKALITASVASMIEQFNMHNIALLQELGYEVSVGCNFNDPGTITKERCEALMYRLHDLGVKTYQIDFSRSPFKVFKHIKALKQLKKVFKENKYDLVHCHSPIGGMLTRMAGKKYRKSGLKMIYTAHGFHFYKGAPKKNWIIFYPIEKRCSKWTDVLITINQEDLAFAKKKMKAKVVEYIPGIGVDVNKFADVKVDIADKRKEIGVPIDAKMILSVGELNNNKNHQIVIKALSKIKNPNNHYVIAGIGPLKDKLEQLAKDLNVNLHLLGYRKDVAELYKTADVFVLPSIREGLNVSVMEALSSNCPTIVSDIRGNNDMVKKENRFNPLNEQEVCDLLSKEKIENDYSFLKIANVECVSNKMRSIYKGE